MARREQESDRRRREEKWQTCWCCQDQQRACRMAHASVEKLEHTGPAKKKGSFNATERAVGKYARVAFTTRERNKAVCPEDQIVRRAFSVSEVKRTAAEERDRDEYISTEGQ